MTIYMYKERLLTPGPTPIPQRIMQAMDRPLLHHRSEVFSKELRSALEGMQWLLNWDSHPLFLACSGTGAMEASILNCCQQGDEIITVNGGAFGARWKTIGERLGLQVHELSVPWGSAASVEAVREIVSQHPNARAFCIQHSETSTTVLHPVAEILDTVKAIAPQIITIVDGISACVTTPVPGSPLNLDIYIAGSQKGFMLPPGLAMVALSKHAWEIVEKTPKRSLYFDFSLERKSLSKGETSWTPASTLIVGLNAALTIFREEGLEAIYKRHALLSRIARSGITALNFALIAPDAPCPSVTGFFTPPQLSADTLRSEVRKRYGIRLAGGQGMLSGKVVRIGHMGYVDPFEVVNAVCAIALTARALGAAVDVDPAVSACLKAM
jgi:aspartate aminotransferase-like enzyme